MYFLPSRFTGGIFLLIPNFALGFEKNGLNRIQYNTPRALLRAERGHGKDLEVFYQNLNANFGIIPSKPRGLFA